MRARQRHFSYKAAGSSITLDSRYITGVSGGSTFTPWSDISGNANNAAQTTAANRPTYVASFSSLAGQPSVNFGTASQMNWTTVTSKHSFLVMHRASGDYYNYGVSLDNGSIGAGNSGVHSDVNHDYTWQWAPTIQRVNRVAVTDNTSKWWAAGGVGYFEDTSGKGLKQIGYDTGGSLGPKAHISHVSLFANSLSSSLVRRIENHLGYSFKLAN